MFESFSRGFRMIWASIKMGWQDKRLLIPSILTVFSNIFFGFVVVALATTKMGPGAQMPTAGMLGSGPAHAQHAAAPEGAMPTYNLLGDQVPAKVAKQGSGFFEKTIGMTQVNGQQDAGGFQAGGLGAMLTGDNAILLSCLAALGWLINRFLEGVTTALVYCHLTEGKGTGKFSTAVKAVFSSLPAIVILGMVTWIARRLAGVLKDKRNSGMLGMSMGFVAGVIEVFWTLAGHLILPAIVIEGCSFWGGLKRADKIASGNLLTIGIGEVGVEGICKLSTNLLYGLGMAGIGGGYFAFTHGVTINPPMIATVAFLWVVAVVVATAMSIYIRSAFYTCLYVWAVEAEAVEETERRRIKPPEPLALALS